MQFSSFFNQVANNFRDRYQQLTDSISIGRTPKYYTDSSKETAPKEQIPIDSYVPSSKLEKPRSSTDNDKHKTEKPSTSTENDKHKVDDSTYKKPSEHNNDKKTEDSKTGEVGYYNRKTTLDYKMKLQFDLRAIQGIAEKIADGDTREITEFAAGGFGLKAAFDIKSKEIIETNMAENIDGKLVVKSKMKNKSKFAGAFGAQSRNFNVQSFYKESTKISKSMKAEASEGYRRTVNKFALRYRMDSKFNFSFINKFNVQTKQISETDPKNLEGYVKSAGNVAESGTTEMMGKFFDTVDSYLNAAESDMVAKAEEFFTMAVEELGFAEDTVALVKDQLVNSIESFFGRVDDALSMMSSQFIPKAPEVAELPVILPEIPTNKEDIADIAVV